VEFHRNTAIEVRFGAQIPKPAKKAGSHLAGMRIHDNSAH
jgi:hypothetical protein